MLNQIRLENLIFIDIETVKEHHHFSELDEVAASLWNKKSGYFKDAHLESEENLYKNRAGLYAEFAKVVCISVAFMIKNAEGSFDLRLKSFYGDEESIILTEFKELLDQYYKHTRYAFCGHNIKDYDLPFLIRRMIINQIKLPAKFIIKGFKYFQLPIIDTFQIWKFGDHRNFTSLKLLQKALKIDFPKHSDIEGEDIDRLYWENKDLEGIIEHCQNDVISVAQLMLRFKNFELLSRENINIIESSG